MASLNTIKTTVNSTIRTETAAGGITPGEVSDILDSIINEIRDRGILFVADYTAVLAVDPTDSKQACDISTGNVYRHNGTNWVLIIEPGAGTGGGGLITLATPTLTATPNGASGDTVIDLSWTNVSGETSYLLEESPNGSTGWTQIGGTIAANTTTYQRTGRTASTQYWYRITAVGDGVTYSNSGYGTANTTTTSGAPSYQTESETFFAANTGLDTTQKNALDGLVVALKAIGWSKFFAVYPYIGGSASAHKWNLINPVDSDAAFRLTFSGSFTHAATGITPAGTSTYQDTKMVPGTHLTDGDVHLAVYLRSNVASTVAGYEWGVIEGGTKNWYFNPRRADDTAQAFGIHKVGDQINGAVTDSRGLWTLSNRVSELRLYKNATELSNDTSLTAADEAVTSNIHLSNYNYSPGEGSTREMAFASIGTGLTAAEVDSLYTAVQAYQTALSRNV